MMKFTKQKARNNFVSRKSTNETKTVALGKDQPVEIFEKQLHLKEKDRADFADLQVNLKNPCILFKDLQNRKLGYFKNNRCADYILYENIGENWYLHIFELKTKVKKDTWSYIKEQFMGAYQNALAIAGFLNISINTDKVSLYTVYRYDKINDVVNPVAVRYNMYNKHENDHKDSVDWNFKQITIKFVGEEKFNHYKIKLDIEKGTGEYYLSSNKSVSIE